MWAKHTQPYFRVWFHVRIYTCSYTSNAQRPQSCSSLCRTHTAQCESDDKELYREVTPAQHALFLQYISTLDFDISNDPSTDTQHLFDNFYDIAVQLLNRFYPERTVTVTTRDPDYMTAGIKARLRRKNRLMHAGRIEEAKGQCQGHCGQHIAS